MHRERGKDFAVFPRNNLQWIIGDGLVGEFVGRGARIAVYGKNSHRKRPARSALDNRKQKRLQMAIVGAI
jgi:hypothetical protein